MSPAPPEPGARKRSPKIVWSAEAESIRREAEAARDQALQRHRKGEDPFGVVASLAADVDEIIRRWFSRIVGTEGGRVAVLAVGGFGRRELCPRSDVDLLFVTEPGYRAERLEKLIRCLWDGSLQLGHAVRTPDECYDFMRADLTTANAVLESRFIAGDRELHEDFTVRAPERYGRKYRDSFVQSKLELLRASVEDPQRSIYVVEPHLKEGACGLRDVQRVLWIENMRHGHGVGFDALLEQGSLAADDVETLRAAYAFYLRVRCEIHFCNNVRQDILERDSAPHVARELGYGEGRDDRAAVESLMGAYYRHARGVYRFLRYYLETGARPPGPLRRLLRKVRAEQIRPYLLLEGGRLFLAGESVNGDSVSPVQLLERVLDIFLVAQERDVRLSETLCDSVRREVAALDPTAFQAPEVIRDFRRILQRGRGSGRLLKVLRETEILGRILPEFGALNCRVSFDGHHQFTVDEHTLKTLEELDRIETAADYPEPEFRKVFLEIKDPLPLRMALLLHDTGKAAPGNHSVTGTEAATRICERLGLDEKVTQVVDFLVYEHLELYRISELRDFSEEGVIESLAKLVQNDERLKMLYLLTYIDIVSVGPGTWTQWKGAQLAELYRRTRIHLQAGEARGDDLDARLEATGADDATRKRLLEHWGKMESRGYAREILPERMLYHLDLIDAFGSRREMQVSHENRVGYHEITFCGSDRPRLFADLTGVLFSEGLSVLGARIYSRTDGVVLDIFQVEVADTVLLPVEERVERIRRKLRRVESKQQMVEDFIRQRTLSYRLGRWRKPLYGPSVSFDNESSPTATVIEVKAGDRPGLLYDLAQAIHRLGLDLRAAKISTLMDRAHDAFYVVERDGGKVDNPARRTEIVNGLTSGAQSPAEVLLRSP